MLERISMLALLFAFALITAPSGLDAQQLGRTDIEILLEHIVTQAVVDAKQDTGKEFEKAFVDVQSVSNAFEYEIVGSRAAIESSGGISGTRDEIVDERLIPYTSHGIDITIGDRRIKDNGLMIELRDVRRAQSFLAITVRTYSTNPEPRVHDGMVRYVLRARELEFQFAKRGRGWKLLTTTVTGVS